MIGRLAEIRALDAVDEYRVDGHISLQLTNEGVECLPNDGSGQCRTADIPVVCLHADIQFQILDIVFVHGLILIVSDAVGGQGRSGSFLSAFDRETFVGGLGESEMGEQAGT